MKLLFDLLGIKGNKSTDDEFNNKSQEVPAFSAIIKHSLSLCLSLRCSRGGWEGLGRCYSNQR